MPQINSTDEVTDALSQFLNILEPVDLREYDEKLISLFIELQKRLSWRF